MPAIFYLALGIYGVASGCSLSVAEGLLVEGAPDQRERTMARAGLAANAGDLGVPVLLALLARVGFGWRASFVAAGLLAGALAISHVFALRPRGSTSSVGSDHDEPFGAVENEAEPSLFQALRTAFTTRPLLVWALACAMTTMLDEVLVAFSALHLAAIGATVTERSYALGAWTIGGFVGLALIERLATPGRARRFMLGASLLSSVFVVLLATTRSSIAGAVALFFVGTTGSMLHPLTKAEAYGALPHRPALVNAIASALLPIDIAAPILLGIVAARVSTGWAVAGILAAPLAVVLAVLSSGTRTPANPPPPSPSHRTPPESSS